jgi:hypothetical protein
MERIPMMKRLAPYGSDDHAGDVAKVGKVKAPPSLAARMPSPDIGAKVGQMPAVGAISAARSYRVVRRERQG